MVKKKIYFDYSWIKKKKSGGALNSTINLHKIFNKKKFINKYQCIFIINKSQKKLFDLNKKNFLLFPKNFILNSIYRFFFFIFYSKKDIYFILNLYSPVFKGKIKVFNLIHDNQWMIFPKNFSIIRKLWLEFNIFLIKINNNKCIFTTKYLFNNFQKKLPKNSKVIIPIPFEKLMTNGKEIKILKNVRYNLIISSNLPHKNINTIINTHKLRDKKYKNFYLVIAGIGQVYSADKKNKIFNFGEISELKKIWLYKNCYNFIIPSLYEGFGMIMIEALIYAKNIISSNLKALKEVGGNEPIYVKNPKSINSWKKLIFNKKKIKKKLIKLNKEKSIITNKYLSIFENL